VPNANNENKTVKIPQVFQGINIAILTTNESVSRVLSKAFTNRGGKVEIFPGGPELLERAAEDHHFHVLVTSDDVIYTGADWVVKWIIVNRQAEIDSFWYVGKKSVSRMDGFIKKPFRPVELLKPIFEDLKNKGVIPEKLPKS